MILTVQVKLLPTEEQAKALRETLELANKACNRLSEIAWKAKELKQFPMHKRFYHQIRGEFDLSSQVVIRLIAKVADAYKIHKGGQRVFRQFGSISYDCRILWIKPSVSLASIWTVEGREKIPFVCGENQRKLLELPHGETDLILRDGKWFLNVSVNVPDELEYKATGWLGCDMGIVNILTDSDGSNYSGSHLNGLRHRHSRIRAKLQNKGTKSAKRLLAKRKRKESRHANHVNHTISKLVVEKAKCTGRGIAIEDLNGIRSQIKARKPQRRQQGSWAFADLRNKIEYKAKLAGVPITLVNPRNTSRKCPSCSHTEKANRRTRDHFECKACGFSGPADHIGSENIRMAAVNQPNIGTKCLHGVKKVLISQRL